jgi:hypothetical protein
MTQTAKHDALYRLDGVSLSILFVRAIDQLRTTSEVSAKSTTTIRRDAQHGGDQPRGNPYTDADGLGGRWDAAQTDGERVRVVIAAARELEAVRHTPPPPDAYKERGTPAWERRIAKDTRSLRAVGEDFGVSHEQVRKLRENIRLGAH